jgi:hypothetical protein
MIRHHHDDEDDDSSPIDRHGVLKDGARVRVPLYLMDATQRAVAANAAHLHDGRGGLVGHKPSFVYSTDASLNDAKERAYAAYDAEQPMLTSTCKAAARCAAPSSVRTPCR